MSVTNVTPTTAQAQEAVLEADDGFSPSGTLIFVLLMLMGYALYWAYLWFVVVIERATGAA